MSGSRKYPKTSTRGKTMHLPFRLHTLAAFISSRVKRSIPEIVAEAAGPTLEHWAQILRDQGYESQWADGTPMLDGSEEAPPPSSDVPG